MCQEMICQLDIISFMEEDKTSNQKIIWACQELILLMDYMVKAQNYNDNEGKEEIGDCIRLLISLFFPQIYLKGVSEEDYFQMIDDKLSESSKELVKRKLMDAYYGEFS